MGNSGLWASQSKSTPTETPLSQFSPDDLAKLKERLSYDPETGLFSWKYRGRGPQRRFEPGCAGTVDSHGYIQLFVLGKLHRAHRVAFLFMLGRWPNGQVDHANGKRDDNRWANLREATASENRANEGKRPGATSKYKGVSWNSANQRWAAQIKFNGKHYWLGMFMTEEEAHETYAMKAKELHGEFARG